MNVEVYILKNKKIKILLLKEDKESQIEDKYFCPFGHITYTINMMNFKEQKYSFTQVEIVDPKIKRVSFIIWGFDTQFISIGCSYDAEEDCFSY